MRFMFGFALALSLTVPVAAGAANPAPAPLRTSGVVSLVDDGEVVLRLLLNAEQKAAALKLPLEDGMPATPGRLGVLKGEIFVRYALAPSPELEKAAGALMGRNVACLLDGDRRITEMRRVP